MSLEIEELQANAPTSESHIVEVGDKKEEVFVDQEKGPLVYTLDGNYSYFLQQTKTHMFGPCHKHGFAKQKPWWGMSDTHKQIILEQSARKNLALIDFKGKEFFKNAKLPSKRMIAMATQAMGMGGSMQPMFLQEPHELPVLCLWYSGGLDPTQGREQMAPMVKAAKEAGLKHVLVLDYPDTYNIQGEGSAPWCRYVDRLIEEIDKDPDRRNKPLIFLGHSRGATPAATTAAKLGKRVLKLYALSSGGPVPGQPSPFQQLSMAFKASTDLDLLKWFCGLNPVPLLLGVMRSVMSGEMTIEESPYLTEKVGLMKRQYVNAIWPDMQKDFKVLPIPILAVAGKYDPNESKPSMDVWKVWSTKKVKVQFIEAAHMDTTNHTKFFIADMVKL